jgi:hypothetical protein
MRVDADVLDAFKAPPKPNAPSTYCKYAELR